MSDNIVLRSTINRIATIIGAGAAVKSLAIALLVTVASTAFAESTRRVPCNLADEIEAVVQENALRTLKLLQEGQ